MGAVHFAGDHWQFGTTHAVFGGNGFVNLILEPWVSKLDIIYSAHGVILAHVFFNFPLVRLILQGWLTPFRPGFHVLPQVWHRCFSLWGQPMLRRIVPGACAVINFFVICIRLVCCCLDWRRAKSSHC
jgi:thiamine transport system permease protein